MKTYSYHELNPLIRLKELELLSPELMERLIAAESVDQVAELLKPTLYGEYLDEHFIDNYEFSFQQAFDELIAELVVIAPEPEVVWIYTMRFTFHNLKALLKAELLNQNFDEMYLYDGFYTLDQLKSAVRTGVASSLPKALVNSIQEVKEHFEESNRLQGIDIILDRDFLRCQREVGEKLAYPALLQEIIDFIDLTNLLMLGRGIKQNRSKTFMSTVLSSQGNISKNDLLSLMDEPQRYSDFLLNSEFGENIVPAVSDGIVDLAQLEKVKDDFLAQRFERSQVEAFGPMPLLALLNAKEVEIKNLRLLVVGKTIGLREEQIRERMRETYDA